MELTKTLVKKILKEAVRLDKLDNKEQELFDKLFSFIAPDSYSQIINTQRASSFIRGVDMVFPVISYDISYFVYDVPSMKSEKVICEIKGKKYNARNIDEYAQFIVETLK